MDIGLARFATNRSSCPAGQPRFHRSRRLRARVLRGEPSDRGLKTDAIVADCRGGPALDTTGGTPDGIDDIDLFWRGPVIADFLCPGAERFTIIPPDGLVLMGELTDGTDFFTTPVPHRGIDQLFVFVPFAE